MQSPKWLWVSKSTLKMEMRELLETPMREGLEPAFNEQQLSATFQGPKFNSKFLSNFSKYVFIERGQRMSSQMTEEERNQTWLASSIIPFMVHASGCHKAHLHSRPGNGRPMWLFVVL